MYFQYICVLQHPIIKINESVLLFLAFDFPIFWFQAELEELKQKEGPEVVEAESTVADIEKLFQTTES